MIRMIASLLLGVAFGTTAPGVEPLVIRGSDTLAARLMPQLCEGYRKIRRVSFDISAEGSAFAFRHLLAGTADIGISSRDLTAEETQMFLAQRMKLQRLTAGFHPMMIIVHQDNPVSDLTTKQVEDIFTGTIANWREVGGPDALIQVHTRNKSSGTYQDFRRLAMSGREYAPSAEGLGWSVEPATVAVPGHPHAIGYVALASAGARGVKALTINGQPLDPARPREYPYCQETFYFLRTDASADATAFVQWATTAPEAMQIVRQAGFLPHRGADLRVLQQAPHIDRAVGGHHAGAGSHKEVEMVLPLHGTKRSNARSGERKGTVGNLPAKLSGTVPVGEAMNPCARAVFTPHSRVIPRDSPGEAPDPCNDVPVVTAFGVANNEIFG